jgi:GH15 family glucan-1,4-alpha-glucosidase
LTDERVTSDLNAPGEHGARAEPRPIGDHALLADSRTAALVDSTGEVAWLCWPRVDSDAVLLSLLDRGRGGTFSVRPRDEAEVVSREMRDGGLVLHTVWRVGRGTLTCDDALAAEGRPGLLRMLRAEGASVLVEVRFRPAFAFATVEPDLRETGRRAWAAGAGLVLAVDAPAVWRIEDGVAVSIFKVVPGYPTAVALGDGADTTALRDAPERMQATLRHWGSTARAMEFELAGDAPLVALLGPAEAERLVTLSGCVISGLRQRGGGLVAAPTTSLPQWPGTSRTWDYRYAWLRDTALGAMALLRVGLIDEAHGLGAFCGDLCLVADSPPLMRVDESPPPPERVLDHLDGYRGARPVRVGNAAALQAQFDTTGEVLELARALAGARALPESLRRAVPLLAERAMNNAGAADHGIWEVRGATHPYTHSQILTWVGLRDAAVLASGRVVAGDGERWARAADTLRDDVLRHHVDAAGALTLHRGGGGPDAALSMAVLTGFLPPGDPRARATLRSIVDGLTRGGLVDRYAGQPDGVDAPCAPFVFATFWLADALGQSGMDATEHWRAAVSARSELGFFSEVADPTTHTPLGNYPQVQSHAALILAAVRPAPQI